MATPAPPYVCVPDGVCIQPQLLYGTYIVIPPVYITIDCEKNSHHDHHHRKHHDDDHKHRHHSHHIDDEKKGKICNDKDLKAKKQKPGKRHPQCPLKQGSFSHPARNIGYYPKQTLEGTVLELYKKEGYPANSHLRK